MKQTNTVGPEIVKQGWSNVRPIGKVEIRGVTCDVYAADDARGKWSAVQGGDLVIVRSTGDDALDMLVARSFCTE